MSPITFLFRHGRSQTWPSAKHSTSFASSLKEPSSLQDLCYMPVRNGWCGGLLRLSWRAAVWQGAGGWGHDHPFPTLCRSSHPRELEGGSFKLWKCVQKKLWVKETPFSLHCCTSLHLLLTDWPAGGTQLWVRSERGLVLQTQPSGQTWCRSWWRGSCRGMIFVQDEYIYIYVASCPT